jgi:hypothetical protein
LRTDRSTGNPERPGALLHEAASAKFKAEEPTTSTDGVAILEPWKHIFPPHICQVRLHDQAEGRLHQYGGGSGNG